MAAVLQEEAEELDITARAAWPALFGVNTDTINVKQLSGLSAGVRKRVLRLWLEGLRGDLRRLDMKHFASLERLVLGGTGGKQIELPGGESVTLSKGRLIFKKQRLKKDRQTTKI
jgi:hypothetical protein